MRFTSFDDGGQNILLVLQISPLFSFSLSLYLFCSACFLVFSCRVLMSSLFSRSALTASSLLEASSGFHSPLPLLCLLSESCLCSSCLASGSSGKIGRMVS